MAKKRRGRSAAFMRSIRPKSRKRTVRSRRAPSKVAKRRRRTISRRGIASGLQQPLVAGVTYAFVQPFLSQFLTRFNIGIQDELVQILAAVVAKNMFKNQIVNNWANAAIIINTASLASGFASNLNLGGGTTTNVATTPLAPQVFAPIE